MLVIQQIGGKGYEYTISALEAELGLNAEVSCMQEPILGNRSLLNSGFNFYWSFKTNNWKYIQVYDSGSKECINQSYYWKSKWSRLSVVNSPSRPSKSICPDGLRLLRPLHGLTSDYVVGTWLLLYRSWRLGRYRLPGPVLSLKQALSWPVIGGCPSAKSCGRRVSVVGIGHIYKKNRGSF